MTFKNPGAGIVSPLLQAEKATAVRRHEQQRQNQQIRQFLHHQRVENFSF
ncbi:hypothetical protein UUU_12790 [Klebsiella pneumoniae subsp. pneumoniae DSM 30104 = JCM 1662 = NBRC 14940]|nr:hypothetical protein UUU_12790 [Klebsiella pneumoniae subsp. pneumoniae DSM 30104 = JCM 1662 = NBRC 14940]